MTWKNFFDLLRFLKINFKLLLSAPIWHLIWKLQIWASSFWILPAKNSPNFENGSSTNKNVSSVGIAIFRISMKNIRICKIIENLILNNLGHKRLSFRSYCAARVNLFKIHQNTYKMKLVLNFKWFKLSLINWELNKRRNEVNAQTHFRNWSPEFTWQKFLVLSIWMMTRIDENQKTIKQNDIHNWA